MYYICTQHISSDLEDASMGDLGTGCRYYYSCMIISSAIFGTFAVPATAWLRADIDHFGTNRIIHAFSLWHIDLRPYLCPEIDEATASSMLGSNGYRPPFTSSLRKLEGFPLPFPTQEPQYPKFSAAFCVSCLRQGSKKASQ